LSRTFDVRFAPTAGLAAVLAAPANTLRWKGAGSLSIHPEAITIAPKRGLLSWFSRDASRRIAAEHLREVYREGAALRLEFTGPGKDREVVPLWANDRDAAAEIMRLMPTTRTVEVEQATGKREPKFSPDLRAIGWLFAISLVIGAGVIVLQFLRKTPVPAAASPAPATVEPGDAGPVEAARVESEVVNAAPEKVGPEIAPVEVTPAPTPILIDDPIVAILPGDRAYGIARQQLALFEKESGALLDEYRGYRSMAESGVLSAEDYATKLDGVLGTGWWKVTFRILEDPHFDDPTLGGLRATELAVARNWRAFLELYTEGLNKDDPALIAQSFTVLERAERLQSRARSYVR
jgi:hypothetical protein